MKKQLPKIYQQRLQKLKKEYQKKINRIQNSFNNEEFYKQKMTLLYEQMEEIYAKQNLEAKLKAEKIIELSIIYESYVEKLEISTTKIKNINANFDKELKSIAHMIKQSKPELDTSDINNLIEEYININSDTD